MQKHLYDLRFEMDEYEWRARAKRDLIIQTVETVQKVEKVEKSKMLDFGCGTGMFVRDFSKHYPNAEVFGVEAGKPAFDYCQKRGLKNIFFYKGGKLPFKNNFFNLVTSADVLEHIKDDNFSLRELYRVTKKGGYGIHVVPAHKFLLSSRDERLGHFRRYEGEELEKKCQAVGFKILRSRNADFLLTFVLWLSIALAPKKNNLAQISTETPVKNIFINTLLYWYECLENLLHKFINFPIGTSILVVVQK